MCKRIGSRSGEYGRRKQHEAIGKGRNTPRSHKPWETSSMRSLCPQISRSWGRARMPAPPRIHQSAACHDLQPGLLSCWCSPPLHIPMQGGPASANAPKGLLESGWTPPRSREWDHPCLENVSKQITGVGVKDLGDSLKGVCQTQCPAFIPLHIYALWRSENTPFSQEPVT